MLLAINKRLINRADLSSYEANYCFVNVDINRAELAETVNLGHAFTCQLKGKRCGDNFIGAGYAALDIDETWTVQEALDNQFIQTHASLIYTTWSHLKDGNGERFRIVFELEQPLYDANDYRALVEGLMEKFPQADLAAKDPARVWFGSKSSGPLILEGYLPKTLADSLIARGEEIQKAKLTSRKKCSYDLPIEEAAKMLTFIDPMPGYEIWRNICFALADAYGEDAIELVENWSPDVKCKGKHLRQLVTRANGKITLGTVIYYACHNGYRPPEEFIKRKRTAEQVAFEDIFNCGLEYVTIGNTLYHYKNGFYQEVPDPMAKHWIAEYFHVYPTGNGSNAYATDTKCKQALGYVKSMCHVDTGEINPPGVNLSNGFLKPSYDDMGNVTFHLEDHTSERYCTYIAPFHYQPDADPTEFQQIMDAMLPTDYQEILFRVLGASMDLPEVRKRKGRAARLLLLYGVGSNGKDTLKEWVSMLYGGHGVTAVPLQVFRNADKDRNFGLIPLCYSRLNWSSENAVISIDHCQTLKNFVTGDELNVEEKNKQGFTIRPKAIGIFNVNELPHIESQQEAINSRYAIIEFPYTFTSNPIKGNERLSNPRIKGDPDFIQSTILPALLNRIIKGFKDILKDGVDYSAVEPLMQSVREENSHLIGFIEETGLIECSYDEGITAKKILIRYESWCHGAGLIELNREGEIARRNNPSLYDSVITNANQIQKRFRKFFPNLRSKAHGKRGRILNLKFTKKFEY